jgi:hypothetical protein
MGDTALLRFWGESRQYPDVSFSSELDAKKLSSVWAELKNDEKFKKLFKFHDTDFLPLLKDRLIFLIEELTPMLFGFYKKNKKLLKTKGIQAAVSSIISDGFGYAISKAAHDNNIPVITWQQGGGYGYAEQPMIIYQNMIAPDFHFVFGDGVAKTYKKLAKKYNTKLIPVGSAFLESVKHQKISYRIKKFVEKNKNKTVLYVITNFYQNSLYISSPPPFSDNIYWRTQQRIMDILGKQVNWNVLVKLHPSRMYRESPLSAYTKERGYNCKFIKNECYFKELLPIANAIVIDFPSTILLESLMTEKPIFVYGDYLKMYRNALNMLRKRVYYSENIHEFTQMLGDYLSGKKMKICPDNHDKEFIKSYGIGNFISGTAAGRATNYVKKL